MLLMDFHVTWMMIIIMVIIQTESAEKSHTPRWPLWSDICLSVGTDQSHRHLRFGKKKCCEEIPLR